MRIDVPESVPDPGLTSIVIVTCVESLPVQILFHASLISTVTAGKIGAATAASVGCCLKLRLSASAGSTVRSRSCPEELNAPDCACTDPDSALYAIRLAAEDEAIPNTNSIEPEAPNSVPSTTGSVPSGAALSPVNVSCLVPVYPVARLSNSSYAVMVSSFVVPAVITADPVISR